MILSRFIVLGWLLGVKVFANEVQHPISDHGVQTSSDCHNAVSPSMPPSITALLTINQCIELVDVLGDQAFYNSLPADFRDSLFSARQREVTPACVIRPLSSEDVSTAVKTISKHNCHFAIKSGGHIMFEGASNADGGITIDLVNLNVLELSEDGATARVGPGNRWGKVFEFVEKRGRAILGGRVSSVGVGGFLLGGK